MQGYKVSVIAYSYKNLGEFRVTCLGEESVIKSESEDYGLIIGMQYADIWRSPNTVSASLEFQYIIAKVLNMKI